jgi:trigger factor
LQERGIEPVDSPNITDVAIREGQPLTFTAAVQTVPPFDPGELGTIALTKVTTTVTDAAVEQALQRLRERAGKMEPVEGRPIGEGDTVVLDLVRTDPDGSTDSHPDVTVTLGSPGTPPGFDANLAGLNAGEQKTFEVEFPPEYPVAEMAGT